MKSVGIRMIFLCTFNEINETTGIFGNTKTMPDLKSLNVIVSFNKINSCVQFKFHINKSF